MNKLTFMEVCDITSPVASQVYSDTDPLQVYEHDGLYDLCGNGEKDVFRNNMSKQELNSYLEDLADILGTKIY